MTKTSQNYFAVCQDIVLIICFLTFQSLILSTAVPTIIGFSLWREVRFILFWNLWVKCLDAYKTTVLLQYCPRVLAELSDLHDFYDSDMVELISWIRCIIVSVIVIDEVGVVLSNCLCFRSQAPASAVFAGSPLLLGAVKLVSGSAMTSLPLYSNINLLKRTEDVSWKQFCLWKVKIERCNAFSFWINYFSHFVDISGVWNEICRRNL